MLYFNITTHCLVLQRHFKESILGGSFSLLPSFGANFLFAWCMSDVLSHDPWQTPASLNQKANCSFVVVLLVAKLEPCMLLVLH